MENKVITGNPLVSIITTTFNSIKYLETCIQSVLNQGYPYIEHVFVDGGSSDGTLDMLASYQARYPERIRFISEPDRGSVDAWNKGWTIARGDIFGWLGSDDVFEPDAMATVVEFFKANPDAHFVFGGCNIINETGELIRKYQIKDFDLEEVINDAHYIPCPSAFYRREVIEKVGFLDINLNELDYWIRVGKVFQIYRMDKVLSNFRVHPDSISYSKGADKMYARKSFIISRRHGGSLFSPRAIRYYRLVVIYYRLAIINFLRPVLGPIYPVIGKVLAACSRRK